MGAALELRTVGAPSPESQHYDVVVIGGGQAGLSVGYHLRQQGVRFAILDAEKRIGDVWRRRWDSLRLFTPARFDSLDGWPFPAHADHFPTRDEMADYLEAYARRFELPVSSGERVESLSRSDGRYTIVTGHRRYTADQVVVAMSSYQKPRVPDVATQLRPGIVQVHAGHYKSPQQLSEGDVLLVGAGNSGAEIAMELVQRGHRVWLSGRDTGEAPVRLSSFLGRWLMARLLLRFFFHRVLTVDTPMGRKARPAMMSRGTPLIRTRRADLANAGVSRVARVTGARDGWPLLADGRVLPVSNVVWCTGFEPAFSWIDLPIFDARGEPRHDAGLVPDAPGLFFVGLHFLYSMSSSMIHGVGRDAARIAAQVAKRARPPAR